MHPRRGKPAPLFAQARLLPAARHGDIRLPQALILILILNLILTMRMVYHMHRAHQKRSTAHPL